MTINESSYVPGMCNINKAEIAYRRKAMWFGLTLSALLFIGLIAFGAAWWVGFVVLFAPVYIAAIGYLQVRNRFCVSYGASGRQNANDGHESALSVTDETALRLDKAKTRRMNLQALVITVVAVSGASLLLYLI
jgi:hypothetical protein